MKSPRGASDRAAVGRHRRHAVLGIRKINAGKPLATKTISRLTSPLDQGSVTWLEITPVSIATIFPDGT
jgi:hypothetical protein